MYKIVLRVFATVVLACVVVVLGGSDASAAEAGPEQHCVYRVVGIEADLELKMGAVECFGTFSEAAAALTQGRLRLPYDTPVGALGGSPSYVALAGSFTIGIHYDYFNGGGSSISVAGSSCVGGWWNTPGWFDNRESSSYNGCHRLRHWDNPGATGSGENTWGVGQIDNLTSMNNSVESVSYHSS